MLQFTEFMELVGRYLTDSDVSKFASLSSTHQAYFAQQPLYVEKYYGIRKVAASYKALNGKPPKTIFHYVDVGGSDPNLHVDALSECSGIRVSHPNLTSFPFDLPNLCNVSFKNKQVLTMLKPLAENISSITLRGHPVVFAEPRERIWTVYVDQRDTKLRIQIIKQSLCGIRNITNLHIKHTSSLMMFHFDSKVKNLYLDSFLTNRKECSLQVEKLFIKHRTHGSMRSTTKYLKRVFPKVDYIECAGVVLKNVIDGVDQCEDDCVTKPARATMIPRSDPITQSEDVTPLDQQMYDDRTTDDEDMPEVIPPKELGVFEYAKENSSLYSNYSAPSVLRKRRRLREYDTQTGFKRVRCNIPLSKFIDQVEHSFNCAS